MKLNLVYVKYYQVLDIPNFAGPIPPKLDLAQSKPQTGWTRAASGPAQCWALLAVLGTSSSTGHC